MRIPLPPPLQRDMYVGWDSGGTTQPVKTMTPHLTIANYEKLEHAKTLNGWRCNVSLEQNDSYRFGFYKDLAKDVGCRVEIMLSREGHRMYDPYTFGNEDSYRVHVHYNGMWHPQGWIKKSKITHKTFFLNEIEDVCEKYKEIALKDFYSKLPWYKKIVYKVHNYINKV